MAKYRCSVCGFIYDEEKEGVPFSELKECPICHQPQEKFTLYERSGFRRRPGSEGTEVRISQRVCAP